MALKFNPLTGKLDLVNDPPLGTLANPFPATGRYFYDTSGTLWVETIDTSGHLVTTLVTAAVPVTGNPIGLLLALTYS